LIWNSTLCYIRILCIRGFSSMSVCPVNGGVPKANGLIPNEIQLTFFPIKNILIPKYNPGHQTSDISVGWGQALFLKLVVLVSGKNILIFFLTRSNVLVRIENESVFICQNTDLFRFCQSNMEINAEKLQCSKPVKAHLLFVISWNEGSISSSRNSMAKRDILTQLIFVHNLILDMHYISTGLHQQRYASAAFV